MKRTSLFAICLFALFSVNLSAQKTNVWKGGAPGHESDWHYYKNWSLGKTPDVFDRVIIPDVSTGAQKYPIIQDGEIAVLSIEVQYGASLILLRTARIVAEEFACYGTCKGCEQRVLIEGTIPPDVAAHR